ncbi:MAG: hypothetical protein RSE00_02330 [Clostridia bacterium]
MEEIKLQKRLSVITDCVIFLVLLLISITLLQKLNIVMAKQTNKYNEIIPIVSEDADTNILEENNMYVKKIKKEYGISVLYGKDVSNYAAKVNGCEQTNIYVINNNLSKIYKVLQKYPNDIFRVESSKQPLYIMLIDKFSDDSLALASRNNLSEFRIYICNTDKFERALHHEIYHILEYCMEDKQKYIFASWYKTNPEGYTYDADITKLDMNYVYEYNKLSSKDLKNVYFVSKYAKTDEKEDRAEVFAELMSMEKLPPYFKKDENIRKKADMILDNISRNITNDLDFPFKFLK